MKNNIIGFMQMPQNDPVSISKKVVNHHFPAAKKNTNKVFIKTKIEFNSDLTVKTLED